MKGRKFWFLSTVAAWAMTASAEPQVVEYTRDGIDYVATIFTDTTATETFTVPANVTSLDYLVVAGGGSGGSGGNNVYGAGGGAGGLVAGESLDVSGATVLRITVGAGGESVPGSRTTGGAGKQGADSVVATTAGTKLVWAIGGGAGGGPKAAGGAGGSGGGGGMAGGTLASALGGAGVDGQGHAGGASLKSGAYAGAGGGAGSAADGATAGTGVSSSITGAEMIYAAGGAGATFASQGAGVAGVDGTGNGGGGGSGASQASGKGGSGIVVLRYVKVDSGKQTNDWVVEPSMAATVLAAGEGTTLELGQAKNGAAAVPSYTEEVLKTLPRGSYTMTFTVAESETWTSLEKSIPFFIRSYPLPGEPDDVPTVYTWGALVDGYWCDVANWTADRTPAFGYPNDTTLASAVIASEATVKGDPDGETFGPAAMNKLTITAPVTLKDGAFDVAGTLTATADLRLENVALTANAKNQLLLLTGNATIRNSTLTGSDAVLYAYGDGKTVGEEGATGANTLRNVRVGYYDKIRSTGTRYVVKNGPGFTPAGVNVGNEGSTDIRFVIDNTEVTVNVSATTYQVVAGAENSFIELAGELAKLTVTKGVLTAGTETGEEQTSGLFFRLPETPYGAAPIVKKAGAGSGQLNLYPNAVLAFDVTNVRKTCAYPLVEDARGSFSNGIAAAGGDAEVYLAQLQKNIKVVRIEDGVEKPADASRVTLTLDGAVLSAMVTGPKGLVVVVR